MASDITGKHWKYIIKRKTCPCMLAEPTLISASKASLLNSSKLVLLVDVQQCLNLFSTTYGCCFTHLHVLRNWSF